MIQKNRIAQKLLDKREKKLLWVEKFTPTERKDIPLYKLSQVEKFENLLNNCLTRLPHSPKVIVITGPVGCGKTTLVNVICREKHIQIINFTPDDDYLLPEYATPVNGVGESTFIAKLKLFLEKCQTVINPKHKQLLLIDDITLSQEDRNNFLNVINQYNKSPRPLFPLIWIADQNDTQKQLSDCYYFKFPPASKSVLKRALKRVSQLQCLDLKDSQINSFIDENPGDVRLAINMLQLTRDFPTGKYDYLSYFQAIGEILYQKNRISSEDILRISHCSPKMMIKGLFENSLDFFADVSEYADCAENFSVADTFMGMDFFVPELAELSATTAMRGVLTSLEHRQENKFFCMRHGSKSHLRNNFIKSDLYHQELLIYKLEMENEDNGYSEYYGLPEEKDGSFVCWPDKCKTIRSEQMDSMLFDDTSGNAYISMKNQMDMERENQIREEELSQAMKLLSIDPIDVSDDGFFDS